MRFNLVVMVTLLYSLTGLGFLSGCRNVIG